MTRNKYLSIHIPASAEFNNLILLCGKVKADLIPPSKLYVLVGDLFEKLPSYREQLVKIENIAPLYNAKIGTVGNGYYSFIGVTVNVVKKLTLCLLHLDRNKNDSKAQDDLGYWIKYADKVMFLNECLIEMHVDASEGQLIPDFPDLTKSERMYRMSEKLGFEDVSVFHGRGLGIHVVQGMRKILRPLQFFQAMYADVYDGSIVSRVGRCLSNYGGLKYVLNYEHLAQRVYFNARDQQVDFCKSFFNMSEMDLIGKVLRVGHHLKANYLIKLPPEQFKTKLNSGAMFDVPVPLSHLGRKALGVRFLSAFRTPKMVGSCGSCSSSCSCHVTNPSKTIIFHVHGGGFISQTSKSHETYLKVWSTKLQVPIISVDYSLAPEGSYPRPVEETLYAYCWMRNNFDLLGTTGENVILAGDSAGGNLVVGLTHQCITLDLPRPNAIALFYPSLLSQTYPSPSRLMTMFDTMAMFPLLLRCVNSYANPGYIKSLPRTYAEELEASVEHIHDPLLSPLLSTPNILIKFPKTFIVSTDLDPCLDEAITFANKLTDVGVSVQLEIINGFPHGFLSMNFMAKNCQAMLENVTDKMKRFAIDQ